MGGYAPLDGTSMATPHVAGAVALLHALMPGSHWITVKNRILASAEDLSTPNNPLTVTARRLNVHRALTCNDLTLLSRVLPIRSYTRVSTGVPISIAALHINCGAPNGDVTVDVSPGGETVTLRDDGMDNDAMAGDGIYSGAWIPAEGGLFTLNVRGAPLYDSFNVDVDPDLQPGFPVKALATSGSYFVGPIDQHAGGQHRR